MGEISLILGYKSCIALGEKRRKIEVPYSRGPEHELISALGIYLSLFNKSWERDCFEVVSHPEHILPAALLSTSN
ncbi:hypothetical protein DPEC_G00167400, partial [Dallia pectoralis]